MIVLSHLHKFFNKGKQNEIHVINDVSLTLPETGIVALFGRSGCGKTTLLNVIGGLDTCHSGSVSEDGKEIVSDLDVYRNRDIGYIFQNYNLLKEETCFENVASALRLCGMSDQAEISARVETALSFVDMDKYARRTPDTLSGGQQQRVAIARAIVKNPRIILADEPTGNLDEVNTVMVMDLLREISRDCLVILVTHEAELVDYYCDSVIELSDGRVMSVRENHVTDGYKARDKNTIYLGELEKTTVTGEVSTLSYYGQKPDAPIALRLVNYGGKTYLSIDTPGVQLLDKDSEMKLFDGTFERKENDAHKESHVDMSRLPRVSGKHFGRLFTAKSAIVSGYRSNFGKRKKGKKLLQTCLALFAAVIVFMTAIFGTAIGELQKIKGSFNPNVIYLCADAKTAAILSDAASLRQNGVDASIVRRGYMYGDEYLYLNTGFFETFDNDPYNSDFHAHGVYLPASIVKGKTPICGRFPEKSGEVLLSSVSADLFLESAPLDYLKDYEDLVGLTSSNGFLSMSLTVVGVVDDETAAFYLDDIALAETVLKARDMKVMPATKVGISVDKGKVGYMSKYGQSTDSYLPGGTVKIVGEDYKIDFVKMLGTYDEYLEGQKIEKLSQEAYIDAKMKEAYPTLTPEDPEYYDRYNEIYETEWAGWYSYFYSEMKAYAQQMYFFEPDLDLWLYIEKGIADWYFQRYDHNLYLITCFEKENGRLPTRTDLEAYKPDQDKDAYFQYEQEYKRHNHRYLEYVFVLNDQDYAALASRYGASDPQVDPTWTENDKEYGYHEPFYAVLHTKTPERTAKFLESLLPEETEEDFDYLLTPEKMYDERFSEAKLVIVTGFVTMAVILGVMSVCMYFIMRSALLNRIREVGIYRAIGVSKKNLILRFAIESAVLTVLTVFVGYLLASGFVFLCHSVSKLVASIFFYPLWLAGAVLLVLLTISMLCGVIPISSLLRKSPSAILAKYDI